MAYVIIEDFRAGLDRRKMDAASVQGSLQACSNAHITRGGEIQKRLSFVPKYSLPPGQTFGLQAAAGVLYTFGSVAGPAVPTGVTYQQLPNGASVMNGLVASEFFDGKVFAVASYASGQVLHFYDGTQVAHFTGGSGAAVAGKQFTSLLTFGSKLYGTAGSVVYFSNINLPADWIDTGVSPHLGAGFVNMANQSAGSETLTALGKYQNLMAIFSRRNAQLWVMDIDDAENKQSQVLSNVGTFAPRSVVSFGEIDVFFLADNGVRSLRARSNSNRAGVTDVGTPIDEELNTYLKTLTTAQRAAAVGAVDPVDGRYILAVGTRCYVFSYYTDGQISAWSRYDLPFTITDLVSDSGKLWARAGDTVYLLGGDSGDTYDTTTVTVETPYIDGRQIATFKQFFGFDIVCQGEWIVSINSDPEQPDVWSEIARVSGTTVAEPGIGFDSYSPLIKLKLVSVGTGLAKISKVVVHYHSAESE